MRAFIDGMWVDLEVDPSSNEGGGCTLLLLAGLGVFGILPYVVGWLFWRPAAMGRVSAPFTTPGDAGGAIWEGGLAISCVLFIICVFALLGERAFSWVTSIALLALAIGLGWHAQQAANGLTAALDRQARAVTAISNMPDNIAGKCVYNISDGAGELLAAAKPCASTLRLDPGYWALTVSAPAISAKQAADANVRLFCVINQTGAGNVSDNYGAGQDPDAPLAAIVRFELVKGFDIKVTCTVQDPSAAHDSQRAKVRLVGSPIAVTTG